MAPAMHGPRSIMKAHILRFSPKSMNPYAEFESAARKALAARLGVNLDAGKIDINGKEKSFDILNGGEKIVGDVKNYRTTRGGNRPSAKFSALNEYCWQMGLVEKFGSSGKWRKLFVIGEDKDMLLQYVKEFDPWLDDIEFYYLSYAEGIDRIR